MNSQSFETLSARLAQMMGDSSRRSSQLHAQFLHQRAVSQQHMRQLIELQMGSTQPAPLAEVVSAPARPALFNSRQLDEFGAGNFSGCFGPGFARYDTRRIPRIPNGDLKMMSRVVEIQGSLRDLRQPASVEVEYDVPPDAWYLRDCGSSELPYSLLMEMALQPCGFLSAYLDTYALVPHEDFYFRNLDGCARVVDTMDVRGKTLTTHAQLITSVASAGTVIQKYSFRVSCAGRELYQGESTFGYFSIETMANQVGLDGGQPTQPWIQSQPGSAGQTLDLRRWRTSAALHLPAGRFGLLDQVLFLPNGGNSGKGYLHARRPVNPQDWFYPFHFSGDPVMPGSLGVEAVLEALKAYALALDLERGLPAAQFSLPAGGPPTSWRYRGQITPQHKMMELEIHLHMVERSAGEILIAGDASVWVDNLRIYEVKNASVRMVGPQ
jgi:3-hydroxymyristoyl/3-hydroxydecanoyl-(acyl carrier protein) dehydratase